MKRCLQVGLLAMTGLLAIPSVASADTRDFYVVGGTGIVRHFSAQGKDLGNFERTLMAGPQALTFDSNGYLYVADNLAGEIHKFSPYGADLGVFAKAGTYAG